MTEAQLKSKLTSWFKSVPGLKAVRIEQRPGMGRGVSDILICYRGRFVAVEVKLPGGKVTPLQYRFLREVYEAGGDFQILEAGTFKEAKATMENYFNIYDQQPTRYSLYSWMRGSNK